MKVDPSTMTSPYQPSPYGYGGNYYGYYPHPQERHSCCNHAYSGGPYTFLPPYHHYPPPPPPPFHGFYPPFPGPYPAYSIPPPYHHYDKNTPYPHHCCACKHHEDENKPRIEHDEPQVVKKTNPFLLKDYPYPNPILLVPPGYMNDGSRTKEKDNFAQDHDPVIVKLPEPSNEVGNGERQQVGDGNRFPFQIFWMPSKDNEVGKDMHTLDLEPYKGSTLSEIDDSKTCDPKGESTRAIQKVIPVKQGEKEEPQKEMETKVKSGSVEKSSNDMDGNGKKSTKTSKLPPVCLRIDPLPRKKNGSRSPSPRREKECLNGLPRNNLETSQRWLSEDLNKSNYETERSKNNLESSEQEREFPESLKKSNEVEVSEPCKAEKKKLSENEAALMVQSAYRGFEVRKSQPLIKLRQIREVRKQVVDLRVRIHDLESSIHVEYDKQRLVIGEMIMSLLLKLDTIQGLHPIVRDIRKSVTKELVDLQEKLDSLTFVNSGPTPGTEQVIRLENDVIQENSDQDRTRPDTNVKPAGSGMSLSENYEVEFQDEPHTGELQPSMDTQPPEAQFVSEPLVVQENSGEAQPQSEFDVAEVEQENPSDPGHKFEIEVENVEQVNSDEAQFETKVENVAGGIEKSTGDDNERTEGPATTSVAVDAAEVKAKSNGTEEEDVVVLTEEAPKVEGVERSMEALMVEHGGAPPLLLTETDGDGKLMQTESNGTQKEDWVGLIEEGGEGKVMEENEKLRAAVDELMKAGKEQVDVIRELTGKVKDLEKKLSNKNRKKKTKGKKGRSRVSVVEELLRM